MGFMAQSLGVDMADIMSGGEMVTALFSVHGTLQVLSSPKGDTLYHQV